MSLIFEMADQNVTEVDVMLITGDVLTFGQRLKSVSYDEESKMFKIITSEGDNFFPRESVATFFVKHEDETNNEDNDADNVISFRT